MKKIIKILCTLLIMSTLGVETIQADDNKNFTIYKGKVIDAKSGKPMIFANVTVQNENIATVTNAEGKFSLKIPSQYTVNQLVVSFIGYKNKIIKLSELKKDSYITIKLEQVSVALSEIKVYPKNAKMIIEKVMAERNKNYMTEPALMTTFYREMIKKRKTYVALSEAVFQVYKQAYNNTKSDKVKLFKGRKSSHPQKMDTLLFKLKSGAYSILQLDVVKNPYLLIDQEAVDMYDYKIENITRVNGKLNYVIEFKQKPHIEQALFFGKIYVDADKFAISSMHFGLNIENKTKAANMFVKKKPIGVKIYPTATYYVVNYYEKNEKWIFNYARSEIAFKVKWKKKLFNTTYTTFIEMAITDWKPTNQKQFKISDRLKHNAILNDEVSYFYDKNFWGDYNIIEPEKTINTAIKKIRKKLDKIGK